MIKKIKNWIYSDKETFAPGMCFKKMFIIFMIGSFIGVIYENILSFIKHYYLKNVIYWKTHRGVIYGPFNPLYGACIAFAIYFLGKKKRHPAKTFIYGALIGGATEYVIGFLMEKILGVWTWNYTDRFLNINGRTTIPYMIFWGAGITFLIHVLYPILSKWIEKIPKKLGDTLFTILIVFMTLNMIISWTALGRQTLRKKGYPPITLVGEFYDKVYTDERLKKAYVNMNFK